MCRSLPRFKRSLQAHAHTYTYTHLHTLTGIVLLLAAVRLCNNSSILAQYKFQTKSVERSVRSPYARIEWSQRSLTAISSLLKTIRSL